MRRRLLEHGYRLIPGGVAALAVGLLLKLQFLRPLEQIAYNALFQLRGELTWDERLVLVAIDDASLQELGRFPLARRHYATLLDQLAAGGSSVVVVDLLWSEPSPDDALLKAAMVQHGQVVLASAWDAVGVPLRPVAELRDGAIATGHIQTQQDTDGLVRLIYSQFRGEPALAVAATQAFSMVQAPINLDLPYELWINWISSAQRLPHYSLVDVIQGRVKPQVFQDKIVIVGVTATGLDARITPFDRDVPASSVYLHATVLNNILQNQSLRPLERHWRLLILVLGGPGLSWVLASNTTRRQLAIVTGLCFSWGMISLLLFKANYLPLLGFPILLFCVTAAVVALCDRLREGMILRRQVHQLWATYHHDLILPVQHAAPWSVASLLHTPPPFPPPQLPADQLATLAEQFGRSQSAQAAIVRNLSIGLVAADWDGRVWFCNPIARGWLSIRVGDVMSARLVPDWFTRQEWEQALHHLAADQPLAPKELNRANQWLSGAENC